MAAEHQEIPTSIVDAPFFFDSAAQILTRVSQQNSPFYFSYPTGLFLIGQSHRFVQFTICGQFLGLRDLRFHLSDQLSQLCLTLTLSAGVNVPGVDLPVQPFGRISPFSRVFPNLCQAASPPFPVFALVRLKNGFPARFSRLAG